MSEQITITPETKIGALLDNYPRLEEVLIEIAPAFKKLRNPILRKTVAKVATLRQVAQIGNVDLGTLINTLRAKVGMKGINGLTSEHEGDNHLSPAWWDEAHIVQKLDARPIIEAGEQPINRVMRELKKLKQDEIYELITPFMPAPLMDMAKKLGFRVWSKPEKEAVFRTFFIK